MAFVPAPSGVKVEMRYTYQGQQVENQLYFKSFTLFTPTEMLALGDALSVIWAAEVAPQSPSSLILREVVVTDLQTDTSPSVTATTGLPVAGLASDNASPSNVTLCVSFRTFGRGRSSRGRNYLLGIREDEVANNIVSTSFSNRWTDFFNALLSDPTITDNWEWSVISFIEDGADRTEGLIQQVLTFTFVDQTVDSQRRRLPGRGR